MEQNLKLSKLNGEPFLDASYYMCLIGRLLNLTVTRLDIAYRVQILSQFLDKVM